MEVIAARIALALTASTTSRTKQCRFDGRNECPLHGGRTVGMRG